MCHAMCPTCPHYSVVFLSCHLSVLLSFCPVLYLSYCLSDLLSFCCCWLLGYLSLTTHTCIMPCVICHAMCPTCPHYSVVFLSCFLSVICHEMCPTCPHCSVVFLICCISVLLSFCTAVFLSCCLSNLLPFSHIIVNFSHTIIL